MRPWVQIAKIWIQQKYLPQNTVLGMIKWETLKRCQYETTIKMGFSFSVRDVSVCNYFRTGDTDRSAAFSFVINFSWTDQGLIFLMSEKAHRHQ